ncbi:uncharacterized protein LOC134750685 [Cydia strobilella]|uniref:uncharacterized protein LOC134750685 n=1 Tax=Cydia strobilella TaxID=1100964 RepID=UPI0030054F55
MHEHHKQTWIELIENYRKLTLLWDRQHKDYSNQRLRGEAYQKLLKIYKTIDSKATLLNFKNKLDIMTTTYNRERKRMNGCKAEGVIYIPNLWYYKYLRFLDKTLKTPEEKERYFELNRYNNVNNKIYLETPLKRKRVDMNSSSTPKSQAGEVKPGYSLNIEPIQSSEEENNPQPPSQPSQLRIKVQSPRIENTFSLRDLEHKNRQMSPDNRLLDLLEKQENFVGTVSKMLTPEQRDWEFIGKSIGLRLSSLEGKQRTIARKLINDVIFFGSIDKLTVESNINLNKKMPDNHEEEHLIFVDIDSSSQE